MTEGAGIGHNSDTATGKRLKSYIERIERVEQEISGLTEDRKEIYSEAKGTGFDPKIIRKIVSLRKIDEQKRREDEEILQTYLAAIGE